MDLLERIQQLGDIHGIDFIGVAGIAAFKKEIESTGGLIASDFSRALSIGIVLPKSIIKLLEDRNTYENTLQYETHAYTVINTRLDSFASIVSSVIQKNGHRVMPVPAAERIDSDRICASISHKITARLAGFGWIGKNCLLINPTHGPGIRWTTVLTDAPLAENQTIMESRCGTCNQCVKACPAQAIKGRNFFEHESRFLRLDVSKCEKYFEELKGADRLAVCGMCVYACPYGG
ncbi:MAG TPA: 4Fe-4S double cluster binding domain-containing protein [Methylomusa anaerophila]|uniref:4Fe-4S double cluster binding domain-containing protein n=1 Tax=Methylomusa anaerophila TaxID=1930071 RepID=UPI002CD31421|nr:4Fe-4S double cluster binding domain-containing protein [Methylomusa anaerophila]HML89557.1 4Fe-4S double cluster binding domain-containing protein [Methylomusa anaerophila]